MSCNKWNNFYEAEEYFYIYLNNVQFKFDVKEVINAVPGL